LNSYDGLIEAGGVTYSGFNNTLGTHMTIFDFGGGGLDVGSQFIFAWTVNCANDVVKEKVSVPEPSMLLLLDAGLLGIVFAIRKNQRRDKKRTY
jgi:hypothetical protein